MRHGPIRWLYGELPGLVERGVLSAEASSALREHYGPLPESSARRILFLVFGVLGALLIGCGIVLLLAHNWDSLARPLRAGLCFALLLVAQGTALGATRWRSDSAAWIEGSGGFLGLAVVACIALVAQTYQMGGGAREVLFASVVLILPAAHLLGSRLAMAFCWVGATMWLTEIPWRTFSFTHYMTYLAFVALAAPFLVRRMPSDRGEPRDALLGWVVCGCLATAGIPLGSWPDIDLHAPFYAGMFGSSYALGLRLLQPGDRSLFSWRRPFLFGGALGLGVLLFVCSFQQTWKTEWGWISRSEGVAGPALGIAVVLALTAGSCIAGIRLLRKAQWDRGLLACAPLLVLVGWAAGLDHGNALAVMLVVNLYAVVAGLTICVRNAKRGDLVVANAGLLLALAVLTARFFDAEISFVVRGVGFIVLGAVFLGMNFWMLRRRVEVRS